jgi:hypothetical protein
MAPILGTKADTALIRAENTTAVTFLFVNPLLILKLPLRVVWGFHSRCRSNEVINIFPNLWCIISKNAQDHESHYLRIWLATLMKLNSFSTPPLISVHNIPQYTEKCVEARNGGEGNALICHQM